MLTFDFTFQRKEKSLITRHLRIVCNLLLLFILTGCAATLIQSFSGNISYAILNQNDPETVRAGAPAFLLLLDGFIEDNPDDRDLLAAAADLYGVYATVFVDDSERALRLSQKSLGYARSALCKARSDACTMLDLPFLEFEPSLSSYSEDDVSYLFSFGSAWAGWVMLNKHDWSVLADLPKVDAIMHRIVELNEPYNWGRAHLYLGTFFSQLPSALGGNPEHGREHFERAIEISGGKDLVGMVELASHFARLMFDKTLHDRLLNQVLEADPVVRDLTLSNVMAQQRARQLLETSDEYFEE